MPSPKRRAKLHHPTHDPLPEVQAIRRRMSERLRARILAAQAGDDETCLRLRLEGGADADRLYAIQREA